MNNNLKKLLLFVLLFSICSFAAPVLDATQPFNVTPSVVNTSGTVTFNVKYSGGTGYSSFAVCKNTSTITEDYAWYFPFKEGTGTSVASYNGAGSLTLGGGAGWVTGKWNKAGDFGTVGYDANITDNVNYSKGFTFMAWINVDDDTAGAPDDLQMIAIHHPPAGSSDWYIGIRDGIINGVFKTPAGSAYSLFMPSAISYDTWYHVAFSFDRSIMKLYLNGVLVASLNVPTTDVREVSNQTTIGNGNDPNNRMNGYIDEVKIWNRSLTQTEIQREMRGMGGYCLDEYCNINYTSTSQTSCNYTTKATDFGTQNYHILYCDESSCASELTSGTFNVTCIHAPFIFYVKDEETNATIQAKHAVTFTSFYGNRIALENLSYYSNGFVNEFPVCVQIGERKNDSFGAVALDTSMWTQSVGNGAISQVSNVLRVTCAATAQCEWNDMVSTSPKIYAKITGNNWRAKVKVSNYSSNDKSFFGLMIYNNDINTYWMGRLFDTNINGIALVKIINGNANYTVTSLAGITANPVWLKIEKINSNLSFWYSTDGGNTWTYYFSEVVSNITGWDYAGMFIKNWETYPAVNVDYDDFSVEPIATTIDSFHSYYGVTGSYESTRYYFLQNMSVTDTTVNTTIIYLIPNNYSRLIQLVLKDNMNSPIKDAYIYFQRFYPGTNEYKLVAMQKTDRNGYGAVYLRVNDVYYRIIIIKDGNILASLGPQIIDCSQSLYYCQLNLDLKEEPAKTYFDYMGRAKALCSNTTLENDTMRILCTVTDTSGLQPTFKLELFKMSIFNTTIERVCNMSYTGSSGTIWCDVANGSWQNESFTWWVTVSDVTNSSVKSVGHINFKPLNEQLFEADTSFFLVFLVLLPIIFIPLNLPIIPLLINGVIILSGLIGLLSFDLATSSGLIFAYSVVMLYLLWRK